MNVPQHLDNADTTFTYERSYRNKLGKMTGLQLKPKFGTALAQTIDFCLAAERPKKKYQTSSMLQDLKFSIMLVFKEVQRDSQIIVDFCCICICV